MSRARALLARFQRQLESIHAIRADGRVQDFWVSRAFAERVSGPMRAPEELLVHQDAQGVSVGLYIDPVVLEPLSRRHPSPLSMLFGELLPQYCVATEGVSHWLYLQHRADQDGPVSQLELEVQAEVDKFASCALGLWQLGVLELVRHLRARLYDGVRYFSHLSADERDRYVTANHLARRYTAFLERRYVRPRDRDGLLRELRRSYRLSGGEKYAYLAAA